ncbi:hypothetical protein AKJ09_09338 [Labilithrix luteola]|uniref:IgGFc-binding protein N-terminal domain-containing protein n=1 Tax=Labilithrix luteola TaxID=1391654 RepID=A0A0K1QB88_9BACT|nr:hypothetical protein AKJ09_09338 [Labilithrix luteola]
MALAAALGFGLAAACVAACGKDRGDFGGPEQSFVVDAATEDAPECGFQCSLDGRSVIDSCTGSVVETCKPELACGAGRCQEPCAAAAADKSSNGCEFYFQMPRFTAEHPHSCYASYIVNTSTLPVDISLELEGKALDLSKAMFRTNPGETTLIHHEGPIPAGQSVVLFVSVRDPNVPRSAADNQTFVPCPDGVVPASNLEGVPSGTGIGTSYHLTTNVPVAVATVFPFGGAASFIPSAMLTFPVTTWSKQHVIVDGWEEGQGGRPATQILASEDGTEVTILPKRDIQNGRGVVGSPATVPVTYKLDKGQLLQFVQSDELTGSVVDSTKPTAIIGGNTCANIPAKAAACDLLAQQIPPFEQWGSEYAAVAYRPRMGNEHEVVPYRIVAARDGTRLDYDPVVPPGAPIMMSAGDVVTFHSGTGDAFVVRSQDVDHPIYLSAHMSGGGGDPATGATYGAWGDPEFVNVVPSGQYLNAYSFYADPTFAETSLVLVRAKSRGAFSDVWLECAGNLTAWKPIGTRGEYEFTRVDLSRRSGPGDVFGTSVCRTGLQRAKSDGPFTATLWGWDRYASYAYPGGMAQRKLVKTPLPPVR